MPTITCLIQALALQWLLGRHGHRATLRIGVRPAAGVAAGRRMEAHAWLEADGRVLIGRIPDLETYTMLSTPTGAGASVSWDR